jgi:hypothetical protein
VHERGDMTIACTGNVGVAVARQGVQELSSRLGVPLPMEARPGADLWARGTARHAWPAPAPLLRAADGWVHPGPPTAWGAFADMAMALGAPAPVAGTAFPNLGGLAVEAVDAEAAAWMLPAAAVRETPAPADPVPELTDRSISDSTVVVLGTAWATPLVGHLLALLGARVLKVDHPRRPDPFPLGRHLTRRQEHHPVDLDSPGGRDRFLTLLAGADLLVVGHPPRVLANAGLDARARSSSVPRLSVVHVAAFVDSDRPGYGPAAEAHGGWAARHVPPRLARSSVADPVAGLVGAIAAVDLLTARPAGASARVSLEGAVGFLLDRERRSV